MTTAPDTRALRPTSRVGIEKITAYPCSMALTMETLSRGRGDDPAYARDELLLKARALNPLWEDPVTMAVNAARGLLSAEDRASIELIIVGTESSPDFGKPISTYVQRHCGIQANCRNFETKHACYGGSAALMMAAHWVASGAAPGKKALVVTSDQSRTHLGKPWEYVLGAGAVAMIVSDQPDVLELDLANHGYWTTEIADTYRPTSTTEVGNADTSLYAYIDALEGAYEHFLSKVGDIDFDAYFKRNIYHVPFGGMTFRAHRTLLRRWKRMRTSEARAHFERKALPALRYNCQFGGVYTGATPLALIGLIDASPDLEPGDRIGIFTYGSGSCAEFYSPRIGARAKEIVAAAKLQERIDARRYVDMEEYEAVERARVELIDRPDFVVDRSGHDGLYERVYAGQGRLVLTGVTAFERHYELS